MELDADCLYLAKLENLERLALALGVRLPAQRGDRRKYGRLLVRAVLKGLHDDKRRPRAAARPN
jgi:hypothetical protein